MRKKGNMHVNIVGWSRGGVACHMLANYMLADDELKNIKVNILALDPIVGGLTIVRDVHTKLGSNVENYIGIFAEDERSHGFDPIVPVTSMNTRINFLSVPGRHSTLAGNGAVDGAEGVQMVPQVSELVRDFSEKILRSWGAELNHTLDFDSQQIENLIKCIEEDSAPYKEMRNKTYTYPTDV
ncbi:hypothetical protein [Candidatus Cyrtobacter comes]|nr:hypothetical protein [Candidatus Cyrtobacter comes]